MNWPWKDTKRCKQLPHKTPHNVFSQIFNFKTFNHQWQVRCSPHQAAIQIKCKDHYLVYSSNSSCQTYTTATTGLFQNQFLSATILALHFTPVSHCVSHWASCSFEQASTLFWRSLAGGVWLEESPLLLKFSSRQPSKQGFVAFLIDLPAVVVCCDLSLHHHPALSQLSFGLKLPPFLSAVSKSN